MRLSDAIALGRTITIPCKGVLRPSREHGCVLDMAVRAVGVTGNWLDAKKVWPWLEKFNQQGNYFSQLWKKFDLNVMGTDCTLRANHVERWTLDQLIDWVRSMEPVEAAPHAEEKTIAELATSLVAQG